MENFHSGIFILKFTLLTNVFDVVQYIVLHPLFSRKAFLMKLFKNFEEQVNFFNVKSYSLAKKKTAIQLKSNKPIKLKYFNVLNVGVIP